MAMDSTPFREGPKDEGSVRKAGGNRVKGHNSHRQVYGHGLERVHHPNVITLRHVIVEDHYVFLVMDYHSGGDLFGAITNKGVYVNNDRAVKRTFLQLIDAVERCHDLGVSHRDLKPENILCSPDYDQVFLGDFGLATQEEVCSSFGCGSSYYMSAGTHT